MKILVTARSFGTSDDKAIQLLEQNGFTVKKLTTDNGPLLKQLESEIVDTYGIIAGLEVYSKDLINRGKQLKIISRYGVGYDQVDLKAAQEQGVVITITPGANGDSVADMAMALMLCAARNVSFMDTSIKQKNQQRPSGIEMVDKTLGVIGAGRIGQSVARRAKGFNMDILCYDMYQDENFAKETGAKYVDLETIFAQADFITIHSPLTEQTKNMFNAETFAKMKNRAIIVNTARGGIINEDDLYEALKNGVIGAAGLDATVEEPPYNSKLLELPNCTLSPHAGAATYEAISKMSYMAAQNIVDIFKTGECTFSV